MRYEDDDLDVIFSAHEPLRCQLGAEKAAVFAAVRAEVRRTSPPWADEFLQDVQFYAFFSCLRPGPG